MTTYTTRGFSRVLDWDTQTYGDFRTTELETVRENGAPSFVYSYSFIDETGVAPMFVELFDPWSHSSVITRSGEAPGIDLAGSAGFAEKEVFAVTWGAGKVTYMLKTFEPAAGTENYFVIGGDAPPITNLATLNAFLANEHSYVLDGLFEGGREIPLAGFLNTQVTENDVVTAREGVPLRWNGGLGDDTITGGLTTDTLIGGAGNDVMRAGGGSDTLFGASGNDVLTGDGSYTVLMGGVGDDHLISQSSIGDRLDGGAGNDLIDLSDGHGGISHSIALGGSGDDTINSGAAGDIAYGGAGADDFFGNDGDDTFYASLGDDEVYGGTGDDGLYGGDDQDSVEGGYGNDTVSGGAGNDSLYGENGIDWMSGGEGDDDLLGGFGGDTLFGDSGDDRLYGEGQEDYLFAGAGNDLLNGGWHDDRLDGENGRDMLLGGAGNDILIGGAGDDRLLGHSGDDVMNGGFGVDRMTGGTGADVFTFISAIDSTQANADTITDFEVGIDVIDLNLMDANETLPDNQDFVWRGSAGLTGLGQVRIAEVNGDTIVYANVSGTTAPDFRLVLEGVTGLTQGDFLL